MRPSSESPTRSPWGVAEVFLGRVIGNVVSTIKHEAYDNTKLMLVQPTDPDGTPTGTAIVAVDTVGAGVGEPVLVLRQGIAAAQVLGVTRPPIRSIIAGIVDHVNVSR
jgi:ethanolamine utilization protein EutN